MIDQTEITCLVETAHRCMTLIPSQIEINDCLQNAEEGSIRYLYSQQVGRNAHINRFYINLCIEIARYHYNVRIFAPSKQE